MPINDMVGYINSAIKKAEDEGREAIFRFDITSGKSVIARVNSIGADYLDLDVSNQNPFCIQFRHIVTFRDVTNTGAHEFRQIREGANAKSGA